MVSTLSYQTSTPHSVLSSQEGVQPLLQRLEPGQIRTHLYFVKELLEQEQSHYKRRDSQHMKYTDLDVQLLRNVEHLTALVQFFECLLAEYVGPAPTDEEIPDFELV